MISRRIQLNNREAKERKTHNEQASHLKALKRFSFQNHISKVSDSI